MPWDSIQKWRDEDGWPPPHIERTPGWWKHAVDEGRSADAVDAVLVENGVYAPPRHTRLGLYAYFREKRASDLRVRRGYAPRRVCL